MELVIIGTIVNHHGLKGEVRVIAHTDYPEERFKKGKTFYILKENEYEKIAIDSVRFHKNFVLLKFNNINDINECLEYKGLDIYSERFEDEKIYITDLIGFDAYDEEDNLIGSVVDYLEVPQGYILELETKEGQKVLVPYVDEFIKEIDFENQEIVIHLIEGMLWE